VPDWKRKKLSLLGCAIAFAAACGIAAIHAQIRLVL